MAIFTLLTLQRPGSLRLQLGLPVYTGPRQPPQELPCISCGSRPHVASRPSVRASRGGFRGVNVRYSCKRRTRCMTMTRKRQNVCTMCVEDHWLVYFNEPSRTSIVARTECGLAVSFGCDHALHRAQCRPVSDARHVRSRRVYDYE